MNHRDKLPRRILAIAALAGLNLALSLPALAAAGQTPGREATPTVVNPVLHSPFRQTISLDGEWQFATDPKQQGDSDQWYRPGVPLPGARRIQVPGCWEAQGVGELGTSVPTTPERSYLALRSAYVGAAWYKKQVTIPSSWRGKELWLKFGGVHAQGWFWANGTFLGHDNSYCGAYKYHVTDLVTADGKLLIAVKVRNDVPSGKGLFAWVHRFGGLYRSVELDATDAISVDDAYVQGDFDAQSAAVHVTLRSFATGPQPVTVEVRCSLLDAVLPLPKGEGRGEGEGGVGIGKTSKQVIIAADRTNEVVLNVPLAPFRPWSPEQPNLYRADIVLKRAGKIVDGWVERFGVRKWEVRGGDFYLNDRRHLVRGFGDDYLYPLTLSSPPSREIHRQHLQLARAFGFNYVRHHTHCEVPEFFDAADELGIMVQPELPYYGATPSANASGYFRPKTDLQELVAHYRRHVSLSTYCTGNEGHMGAPIDQEIYALAKVLDPTRLFQHQDGGRNTPENSDFGTGPVQIWGETPQDQARAWFCHEYLNLSTDEDPRLADKYTGAVLPPVAPAAFRKNLAQAGLDWRWGTACLDAGNQLQRLWQKRGLERARLAPECDGYIYWTIVDVGNPSAQGLFNQFWQPKASRPEYFRRFNGPSALLAKFPNDHRILAGGDTLEAQWWISHFAPEPIRNRTLRWQLRDGRRVLSSGSVPGISAETGEAKPLASTKILVPPVSKPMPAELRVELAGTGIENRWDFWLFPNVQTARYTAAPIAASASVYAKLAGRYPGLVKLGTPAADTASLVIARVSDAEVEATLKKGRNLLLLGLGTIKPGVKLGWWTKSAQTGTAVAEHPAFGGFPHQGYLGEQFFRIVGTAAVMKPGDFIGSEPLMVGHGSQDYLLYAFQARVGASKLLACGLDLLSDYPEAAYLLEQFIQYTRSPRFAPRGEVSLEKLLPHWAGMRDLNGWSETLAHKSRVQYGSFLGELTMDVARFAHGEQEVAWLTQPVPQDLPANGRHTFKWIAALGWFSEPAADFQLFLADQPLLTFGVTQAQTTWKSPDGAVTLRFTPVSAEAGGQDRTGFMELTLPASRLKPGEKARLRVLAPQTGSQRWFGIYHYP